MSGEKVFNNRGVPPLVNDALPGGGVSGQAPDDAPRPTASADGPPDATVQDATLQVVQAFGAGTEPVTMRIARQDDPAAADAASDAASDLGGRPLPSTAALPDLHRLHRAGRYLIRERLGRGGMGTVFRAHDPDIGRDVALKFLHTSLCEEKESRARFLREARAAGRLSHPSIVTVHDVGEIEGRPYMAMELIDGTPLGKALLGQTALPVREAVLIGIQLGRALDYAHARGIVHRDIKPGNIMRLTGTQAIKVTDFGIAHMEAAGAEHRTRIGAILGTPEYMSPEQAQGRKLDGRSDLFSTGIVLYEMLTGRRPFAGGALLAVAMTIVKDPPVPIGTLRPDLPASLRRVVERCLAKSPDERFRTGRELSEALEKVLAELDEQAREKTRPRILSLGARSAATMAVVVAVVMAVTMAFVTQRQRTALMDQMIDSGASVSRFIAAQNAASALAEEWVAVDMSVRQAMKTRDFHSITVTDRDGVVRAAGDPALLGRPYRPPPGTPLRDDDGAVAVSRYDADGVPVLGFQVPITFQGVRVGTVALALAEEPLARVTRLSIGLLALLVLVTVLAVTVAAYVVVNGFAQPVRLLGAALAEIERGHFDHRIGRQRRDEFGVLYAAFDRMAESLQERQAETNPSVVDAPSPRPGTPADESVASLSAEAKPSDLTTEPAIARGVPRGTELPDAAASPP